MDPASPPPWNPYDPACPTRLMLDRIGDKWTVLILRLLAQEPLRFNALRRAIAGISQKVLSQTLKDMERDGLVSRAVFATVPVTVEYAITPLGASLAGAVAHLIDWASDHAEQVLAARAHYDRQRAGEAA